MEEDVLFSLFARLQQRLRAFGVVRVNRGRSRVQHRGSCGTRVRSLICIIYTVSHDVRALGI